MEVALILLSILLFGLQSAALRKVSVSSLRENLLTTGVSAGMIAVCLGVLLLAGGKGLATVTISYGVGVGVMFLVTLAVYYFAMKTGPLSYTGFFFSASMLIPAAIGLLFWQESFTIPVQIGIVLFLAAFFFITVFGGEKGKKGSGIWLLLCFLTWLSNGSLSVLITLHQKSLPGSVSVLDSAALLFVAFVTAFLIAFILFWVGGDSSVRQKDLVLIRRCILPLALVAMGTGGGNIVVSYLSGHVPSSYLFPFVQGGTMVAVTLYALIFLREKLTRLGQLGILLGIVAIVVINL